jgi:hypothetical protein
MLARRTTGRLRTFENGEIDIDPDDDKVAAPLARSNGVSTPAAASRSSPRTTCAVNLNVESGRRAVTVAILRDDYCPGEHLAMLVARLPEVQPAVLGVGTLVWGPEGVVARLGGSAVMVRGGSWRVCR